MDIGYRELVAAGTFSVVIMSYVAILIGCQIGQMRKYRKYTISPPNERCSGIYSHSEYAWAERAVEEALGNLTLD